MIPEHSTDYWLNRLKSQKLPVQGPTKCFGDTEEVLTLYDPDGLIDLLKKKHFMYGIPIEHAIRGFYSVTLSEVGYEYTAHVLTKELGFKLTSQDGNRFRFQISEAKEGVAVDGDINTSIFNSGITPRF